MVMILRPKLFECACAKLRVTPRGYKNIMMKMMLLNRGHHLYATKRPQILPKNLSRKFTKGL